MAEHHEGQRIRQYTLKKLLGRGGMGEVWLAAVNGPMGFNKNVCIKTMLPEAAAFLDHFATEAKLGGRLAHSNLVNALDFFDERGEWFIVMEYVEGLNLLELIEKYQEREAKRRAATGAPPAPATLPSLWVAYIGWFVSNGLHFAHTAAVGGADRRGVVHRDISPGNIMISNGAEVKACDFGIAQVSVMFRAKTEGPNFFKGKPLYASPEQVMCQELDARADVYQLGVVMYEALAGVHPFIGSSHRHEMNVKIVEGTFAPLLKVNPSADRALAAVVEHMMHKDQDKRPQTAEAAADEILAACPSLLTAARPLAEAVRSLTAHKRRPTSVWKRPEDDAHMQLEAPRGGGVVIAAQADEPTHRLTPEMLAGVASPRAQRDPNAPQPVPTKAERVPIPQAIPQAVRSELTERLPPPARRRRAGTVAVSLFAVAAAALGGGSIYVAQQRRNAASAEAAKPSEPAKTEAPAAESPPAVAVAAPPPPAPAPIEPSNPPKREKGSEGERPRHHRSAPRAEETPTGRLIVVKEAEPVRVEVDGTPLGYAPINYQVEPGVHKVTLWRASEGPVTTPVTVAPGSKVRLNTGKIPTER